MGLFIGHSKTNINKRHCHFLFIVCCCCRHDGDDQICCGVVDGLLNVGDEKEESDQSGGIHSHREILDCEIILLGVFDVLLFF